MTDSKTHIGSCLCGDIRFAAKTPALKPHLCSCTMCQQHSGAITVAWVEFPKDAVSWIGPGGAPATYRSSDYSRRAFCQTCGSTLGAIDDAPVVALLLGCFDDKDFADLIPAGHSYKASAPAWWRCLISRESQ